MVNYFKLLRFSGVFHGVLRNSMVLWLFHGVVGCSMVLWVFHGVPKCPMVLWGIHGVLGCSIPVSLILVHASAFTVDNQKLRKQLTLISKRYIKTNLLLVLLPPPVPLHSKNKNSKFSS